ncbi:MAG: Lrp/AsnC family transcriptional regulator [Actinomycetota bacterium]|nr:Lrp/AsnC family transcriptional regulator [Actinomycetota bacterium]
MRGRPVAIALDHIDWKLLEELQSDARLSFSELSRRVHLSAPAVGERVRRLEQARVLTGYHAAVDLTATGWAVLAMVRIACYGSTCVLRDPKVATWPGVLEIHRVTGEDCSVLKVAAVSMQGFEQLIDKLAAYGTPASTLILSSPLTRSDVVAPENLAINGPIK